MWLTLSLILVPLSELMLLQYSMWFKSSFWYDAGFLVLEPNSDRGSSTCRFQLQMFTITKCLTTSFIKLYYKQWGWRVGKRQVKKDKYSVSYGSSSQYDLWCKWSLVFGNTLKMLCSKSTVVKIWNLKLHFT